MRPFLKPLLIAFLLLLSVLSLRAQRRATILDHMDRIRIHNLRQLNSTSRETNLSITPDGRYLYFMSLRGGQRWSQSYMVFQGDSVYDGDIWFSEKMAGEWQRPQAMPFGINTSSGEDEPNISPDGKTVYFQSWNYFWDRTGGPYYRATREGSTWSKPQGIGGGITEFFRMMPATDGMAISPDGKTFLVAAGVAYDGAMDLYMSKKTSRGWTYCKKLDISTSGDDRSVFIAADNRTIYFASDGYDGLGGLDIYKTTLQDDGSIGEVINLGEPFNSPKDDYGFIMTGDGAEAYFVRDGDIHYADLTEADPRLKPPVPEYIASLMGTIRDSLSWKGLQAEVLLLDALTKRVVAKVQTGNSGSYRIDLPNEQRVYDEIIMVDGYPKRRRRVYISQQSRDEQYTANFLMAPDQSSAPVIAARDPLTTDPGIVSPADPATDGTFPASTDDQSQEEISVVTVDPAEDRREAEPIPIPPAVEVPEPEDPYSFDGVAENNLVLLLDVSASMKKPDRLPLLKESFRTLLEHMRPEDQISVVAYSGDARVVIDGVSAARKEAILTAIDNLSIGGGTRGRTALKKALRVAEANFIPGGNNRIILATDGYFDVPDLYGVAGRISESSMSLTVFSFGKLSEQKANELTLLANLGNGNYSSVNRDNVDDVLLAEAKAVRK